jgi:ABC-type nitrate/sulfonate/bicarbonate transport system ATPase subunit/ABC-type transporter Mla maintaining outer membrane lipid asymmetry permease subunit MlaE
MQKSSDNSKAAPIVTLRARPLGPKCPFGKDVEISLRPGGCVSLVGNSGMGKTTLATVLVGLPAHEHVLKELQLDVECEWDSDIPLQERCGVLFQQTTLLDELTVAGNLLVALKLHKDKFQTNQDRDRKIKQLLDTVGLDYDRDAGKRPTELSGGMGRRASLALQLAQHKRVIILDEPFTGLDYEAAVSVAKELVHLRQSQQTALLLISHEPHLSKIVMDPNLTSDNVVIEMQPPSMHMNGHSADKPTKPSLFGTTFSDRFLERLLDYTFYSLPLIALAFCACGLAIAMLSADLLERLDINDQVLDLVDKEVRPLIKMLTGEDATSMQMFGIRFKVSSMLNRTVPPAKASLFAIGLAKLFVLEIGPLLTALLLCGRIGGSYAGRVGTMQATSQNKLLRTLGVNPQWWTLWPSLLAALIASPLLTVVGTGISLVLGGMVGPRYGIGNVSQYWDDLRDSILPMLRLKSFAPLWDEDMKMTIWESFSNFDLTVMYSRNPTWTDSFIEISTFPPIYHLLKATVFIFIIMGVAEFVARWQTNLTPRGVPSVITFSVVSSGLLVILADWGFSQLWLLRD